MRIIKNYLDIIISKILIYFGYKYDEKVIPEGMYCYKPDIDKNLARKNLRVYYTIPCKYYKNLGKYNGCEYLGIITDDDVFADRCKICGIDGI